MDEAVVVPGVPMPLRWRSRPESWIVEDSNLKVTAGAGTDWFADPVGTGNTVNAPALLGVPQGDFMLSARAGVGFGRTFDAGVLALYADDQTWAKLCFELSPQAEPMIVSVVTRTWSDDCNGFVVDGPTAWLRISRLGQAYAFHASTDGSYWHLVRYFSLALSQTSAEETQVGFLAQSPQGEACTVRFDQIRFRAARLTELRDGT